jgi:hypothetical protein
MPRFFFDTNDGDRILRDEDGSDLAGIGEAKAEAVKALAEVARSGLAGGDYREFAFNVRDEGGHTVFRARLTLVIESLPDAE